MKIGEVSERAGVSPRMIRHYEKIGLISKAARRVSGYRDYDPADLHTLHFIGRARDLGFPIEDIRHLLQLWQDRSRSSADVKALALARAGELGRKAQQLERMRATLLRLAEACSGDSRPHCPIIEDLESTLPTGGRTAEWGVGLDTVSSPTASRLSPGSPLGTERRIKD